MFEGIAKLHLESNPRFFRWIRFFAIPSFAWIWIALCLSSCGYRWTEENGIHRTLTIPYAIGDEDGTLTTELIHQFSSAGQANIIRKDGSYRLEVKIIDQTNDIIGFRLDRQDIKGKIQKNLVADEGRTTLIAEVALYKREIEEPLFGPCRIGADTEFDYVDGDSVQDLAFIDSEGAPQTVLAFSLGQLESIESAREAVTRPLYQKLCQKIVDVISAQW